MRVHSDDFGFKMKHTRNVVDFAIGLSKSLSSREIAKRVFQKFGIDVSHVTINDWIHEPGLNKGSKVLKGQQEKECSMSELNLFEQLLTKGFATATMGAYGKVLVIPSKDFANDWNSILRKEGHNVFAQSYQGRAAFLVAFERRVVTHPTTPEKIVDTKDKNPFWWSSDDERRLLKRMKEVKGESIGDKAKNLLSEFPGRTLHALKMKYAKLLKYSILSQTAGPPEEIATAVSEKETVLSQTAGLHETMREGLGLPGNIEDEGDDHPPGCPFVKVEWVDAVCAPDPICLRDVGSIPLHRTISTGFLVHFCEESVTLAGTYCPKNRDLPRDEDLACELTVIPRKTIVKILTLVEDQTIYKNGEWLDVDGAFITASISSPKKT